MPSSGQAFTFFILAALIGSLILNTIADALNLKNLKVKLPKEFESVYAQDRYTESQEYLKANTRFGIITALFDTLVLLGFWFGGGFQILDFFIRSLGFSAIVSGLLYTGSLLLLKLIIDLPFSIYSTFVIEEKFGFNRTTPAVFLTDLIKSIILTAILGGIVLSAVLWFFENSGPLAWIMCWIACTVFLLAVQYIVPTWIMPLFNKFTPLEDGPLKQAILDYAGRIRFSLSDVYLMDGSKRSSKSNAFFIGFGKNKRIVLFDTLIKNHSTDELVSVLAHEMGHFKKKHIIKRMGMGILQMGLMFYLLSFFISSQGLFDAFLMESKSIYAGLIFFGMLYSPIDLFLSILLNISSRKDEFEADRFAAETLQDPAPLITALKNLSSNNLSNLTPHPFYVFLNYSHPPLMARVNALTAL